jgi:ketosteroid isomerase-like protein
MKTSFAVAAILVAAASNAYSQCPEAEKTKLEQFDRAWGNAGEKGDRAHLQSVFADDFAGLSPAGLTGKVQAIDTAVRDAERARASGRPAPKVVHDYYQIGCTPNTATITHRNVVTESVDGKERTFYTRSVHMLEKRSDGWKVVSNAGHPLNDGAILLYMEREWNDADMKRDFAWHERSYADDFSGINGRTGALSTKSEEIASSKQGTVESAELSELDVRVEGSNGVVTGINRVKGKDAKGAAFDRNVRFTDTFVKRDGRWMVWATQGTDIK